MDENTNKNNSKGIEEAGSTNNYNQNYFEDNARLQSQLRKNAIFVNQFKNRETLSEWFRQLGGSKQELEWSGSTSSEIVPDIDLPNLNYDSFENLNMGIQAYLSALFQLNFKGLGDRNKLSGMSSGKKVNLKSNFKNGSNIFGNSVKVDDLESKIELPNDSKLLDVVDTGLEPVYTLLTKIINDESYIKGNFADIKDALTKAEMDLEFSISKSFGMRVSDYLKNNTLSVLVQNMFGRKPRRTKAVYNSSLDAVDKLRKNIKESVDAIEAQLNKSHYDNSIFLSKVLDMLSENSESVYAESSINKLLENTVKLLFKSGIDTKRYDTSYVSLNATGVVFDFKENFENDVKEVTQYIGGHVKSYLIEIKDKLEGHINYLSDLETKLFQAKNSFEAECSRSKKQFWTLSTIASFGVGIVLSNYVLTTSSMKIQNETVVAALTEAVESQNQNTGESEKKLSELQNKYKDLQESKFAQNSDFTDSDISGSLVKQGDSVLVCPIEKDSSFYFKNCYGTNMKPGSKDDFSKIYDVLGGKDSALDSKDYIDLWGIVKEAYNLPYDHIKFVKPNIQAKR